MRAIVYCRKSTDREDMQMQSLDIQLQWALEYCKSNKMTIAETILESKSASKITWREGFQKLVEHFEKWTADVLIVYNIDRIARNPLDEWNIKWLAQQWKIKQIHSPQWVFDWRQILVLSLHMAMANQYTIDLSARIKDGKKKKVEKWKISWRAPLGYQNDKNNNTIEVKDDESIYIKRIFEMRSEWHSLELIADQIHAEWFRTRKWYRVSKTVIERIIKSPFYYWVIAYKDELFKWDHNPIVSKELWDKANSQWRWITVVFDRDITPLKWMVKHYETWTTMTASLIKNKQYVYFHLHSKVKSWNKLWCNQNNIIKEFDKNIDLYCIPEHEKENIKEAIFEECWNKLDNNKKERKIIKWKITKLEKDKTWLITMRRNWELTTEEFLEEKNNIINEIEDYENKLIGLNRKDNSILDELDWMLELFINLNSLWKTASMDFKSINN